MPTIIALDMSLSMLSVVKSSFASNSNSNDEDNQLTRKKLAIEAINQFCDHVGSHCKLEFISVITFSSNYEVLTPFTRDLDVVRKNINSSLTDMDKTNFETFLKGINDIVLDSWGTATTIQIFLISDGSTGFSTGNLKNTIQNARRFVFPCKMNILAIGDPEAKNYTENCQMLQKLIEVTCGDGLVYFPESLTSKGCSSAVSKLCAKDFTPYKGTLRCGQLSALCTLCPPPQPFVCRSDERRYEFSDTIEIIGFIDTNDLSSPPALSRHLILPLKSSDSYQNSKNDEHEDDDSNQPNFCVLLHGALKIESLCAFCEIGQEWYGFIYSWNDNKKKSNLMLSKLPPGYESVPWLGNMLQLGPKDEFIPRKGSSIPSFPIKFNDKKSYTGNIPACSWLTSNGLNNDIQRLLRQARKLPDKLPQFYKDLNRIRRFALTLGFDNFLETIAQVLERECMVLTSSHANVTIELTHAVNQLRSGEPFNKPIHPHSTAK